MKICIPTKTDNGLKAEVYGHFGSAPFFAICDTQTGEVEFLDNGNQHHEHGQCNPTGAIAGKDISAILVGGIGARAIMRLNAEGIKAYRAPGGPLSAAIELFKKKELPEITPEDSCREHGCH